MSNVVTTRWITVSKPFLNDKMRSLNVTVFVILNCENLFFIRELHLVAESELGRCELIQ